MLVLVDVDESVNGPADTELLRTVAEQISMALANLDLRETLKSQSLHDPLTGLFNRRYLSVALDRELSRAQRRGTPVSLIMCDLDHFKRLNDTCGHDVDDRVLVAFAELLRTHCRGEDIPCRYGGEEFLVLLPDAPLDVAMRRADELRIRVREIVLPETESAGNQVNMSLGVATYPLHAATWADLISRADAALYRAKHAGRDRVEAADTLTTVS